MRTWTDLKLILFNSPVDQEFYLGGVHCSINIDEVFRGFIDILMYRINRGTGIWLLICYLNHTFQLVLVKTMILASTPLPKGVHPLAAGMLEEFIIVILAASLDLSVGAQREGLVGVPICAPLHSGLFTRRL